MINNCLIKKHVISALSPAVITANNDLWVWGPNFAGQLGDGTHITRYSPIRVMDNIISVSGNGENIFAIDRENKLWVFGRDLNNRSNDIRPDHSSPHDITKPIQIMDDVAAVSANTLYIAVITTEGSLLIWGYNSYDQLSKGSLFSRNKPVKIMSNVIDVFAHASGAITADRTFWGWGPSFSRWFGDGKMIDSKSPIPILKNVISGDFTMAVTFDNDLWAWGENLWGERGDGNAMMYDIPGYEPILRPKKIMRNMVSVSKFSEHAMAIDIHGGLWTWGRNREGQLGDGTNTDRFEAVKIMNNTVIICAGFYHSMAVTDDGSLWTWGSNYKGQLGIGDSTIKSSNIPIKIMDNIMLPMHTKTKESSLKIR